MFRYLNRILSRNILRTFSSASFHNKTNFLSNQLQSRYERFNRNYSTTITLGFSLFAWSWPGDKEFDPEDEIITMIKRSILAMKRKSYNAAEQLLHLALTMAQKQNNQLAITYIYDVMANCALERGEYGKAMTLYVLVMQRLLAEGTAQDDLKMIHMSVKVARIKYYLGEYPEAEQGFIWCLDKLNRKKTDPDALILMGVTHDYYAVLLLATNRAKEAVKSLKIAYDIMSHSQNVGEDFIVRILNDLGTACWSAQMYDEAELYLLQGIEISRNLIGRDFLPSLMANLGLVFLSKGMVNEAKKECKHAWDLSRKSHDDDGLKQANYCLDEIEKTLNK